MDKNKDIINLIKERDIDGENMQIILEQVGMDYQMYKQLNVEYAEREKMDYGIEEYTYKENNHDNE